MEVVHSRGHRQNRKVTRRDPISRRQWVWSPSDYIGTYLDTLVHDPEMLQQVMAMIGVEKFALGSDYPFPLGEDQPGAMIEAMKN